MKNPQSPVHKIALIIPTRNRSHLLEKLLNSILLQTAQPHQIIIVDGSDLPNSLDLTSYSSLHLSYIHVTQPGLTKQRNIGINCLQPDITIAGYLDDDIELFPETIEAMLRFWEMCSQNTGGTEFNIINVDKANLFSCLIRRFFCMDSSVPGKVLRSGFCTSAFPATIDHPCEWLCGGATIWRREVLDNYKFDEWYAGWAYHEDAEFSYRVFKKNLLYIVSQAKVTHNPLPIVSQKNFMLGKIAVINRYHFVKKNPELSTIFFYWSTIGEIFVNVLQSIWERSFDGTRKARGNLSAIYHILTNDLIQVDENFRK